LYVHVCMHMCGYGMYGMYVMHGMYGMYGNVKKCEVI